MKKILIIIYVFVFLLIPLKVKGSVNNGFFENLTENYSYNPFATCTFVSTTMLLSYYDTYLNDDIILEQYDVSSNSLNLSPGVYRESINTTEPSEYIPLLIDMKNYSLQGLLVDIAVKLGYNDGAIENPRRVEVLKYYFDNYTPFEYGVDYIFSHFSHTEKINGVQVGMDGVLSEIKSEINLSRPVIMTYDHSENTTKDTDRGSHAVVAYDYTEDNVYFHLGDESDKFSNITRCSFSDYEYTWLTSMFSIQFNIEHKHSNNYVIDDADLYHINYCPCGYQSNEAHTTIATSDNIAKCKECNKVFSSNESFTIMLDPSTNSLCGTYVNLYGGNLNSNEIIKGYTRIAYITGGEENSRLDYNWSSSDENVCEVTKYGTILAKNQGSAYVIASSKAEPFKYDIIMINVNNDYSSELKYIEITTDIRVPSELNGTEVTINNGNPNEFTIHSGYTRALSFKQSNSYPSIDNFVWYSSDACLEILSGGYVKANNVDEETEIVVNGYCIYNYNIAAVMTFTVIPSEGSE